MKNTGPPQDTTQGAARALTGPAVGRGEFGYRVSDASAFGAANDPGAVGRDQRFGDHVEHVHRPDRAGYGVQEPRRPAGAPITTSR